MTSEQPPRDALRPYRPLPSIDIPLLREERSAVRSRRLVRVAILAALGAVGLAAVGFGVHALTRPSARVAEHPLSPEELAALAPAAEATGSQATSRDATEFAAEPSDPGPAVEAAHPSEPAPPVSPSTGKVASRVQHSFGKALSFRDALEKNGLSH